jgi:hypothetical protein
MGKGSRSPWAKDVTWIGTMQMPNGFKIEGKKGLKTCVFDYSDIKPGQPTKLK